RLAHRLRSRGVGAEARVGICLDPGAELVVAVLGVLKAGGAYVPLDPFFPAGRLAYTLADSGASLLVTQSRHLDALPPFEGGIVLLDRDADASAREPDGAPVGRADPRNAAYVVYTSGSTGRPKGVVVTHAGVAGTLLGARDVLGFRAGEVMPVLASCAFDIWGFEVFAPLLSGGEARLLERDTVRDVDRLVEELAEADALHAVPALMREIAARVQAGPGALPRASRVFVGGDAVPPDLIREMQRVFPSGEVWVLYGPTETSILGASSRLRREEAHEWQVVGRALPGAGLYVCDGAGGLLPPGLPGELWIGGAGVARGYLGRPELTAEKFVPDALGGEPGARLYRTGDRVRRRTDGELEFLGRIDAQVKIRGFRIEPGEIEAALTGLEGVRDAVVVVREDTPGRRQLAAYVVPEPGAEASPAGLRDRLRARLPEYMVPGVFVMLERLPLNVNGKVDRPALPAPDPAGEEAEYLAPRTQTEEVLCVIWAEVLERERVGVESSFFDLGGHSLLATRLVSRIRQAFGVEVPLRALFEAPTVTALAGRVEALLGLERTVARIPRRAGAGPSPLSFAQQRLWFIHQLDPGSSAYNMPASLRLRGALDVRALRRSLAELVRRHEAVRTAFVDEGGEPVQVVLPAAAVPFPVLDLAGLPEEPRRAEALRRVIEDGLRPFDLRRGPLLRVLLVRLAGDEWVLGFTMHHVVSDGWSMGVLAREVSALYAAYTRGGESPLPELEVQYADFAVWQRKRLAGEVLDAQLRYWRETLEGAPRVLELPTDHPRGSVLDVAEVGRPFEVSAATTRGLRALARRESATLFMTLLAGWQTLLGRYTGQDDVVVGTPIANRTSAELEGLIGFFVNTLVLRGDLSGDPGFGELLGRVRETTLGAFAHQDLPFEKLVEELAPERSVTHNPLFQVMFALQNVEAPSLSLGEL
ncbi:MAG TPA: amino acid adenylation domain-containing protein, partial [Longimicrobiaceae bacterium]